MSVVVCSEPSPGVPQVYQDCGGDQQAASGHSAEESQAQPTLLRHLRQGSAHIIFLVGEAQVEVYLSCIGTIFVSKG
jgi:hypothetical protein